MKFLHTMGAIGLMGAMACLLVLLGFTPPPSVSLAVYSAASLQQGIELAARQLAVAQNAG